MPIDNRDWYRAEHRVRRQAERRRARRTLWLTRAAIGGLFLLALGLAAPLLGNVAANMACRRLPVIALGFGRSLSWAARSAFQFLRVD
jgi:hypothetical protein